MNLGSRRRIHEGLVVPGSSKGVRFADGGTILCDLGHLKLVDALFVSVVANTQRILQQGACLVLGHVIVLPLPEKRPGEVRPETRRDVGVRVARADHPDHPQILLPVRRHSSDD
eukprot:CAMPEP_0198208032 /NCGR_PEP_ID=MMETSP1445-20131203/11426_1 /TAXON_ID=36898 /ORGANISM="Pyramimonas sp., Strain CCMP2087" /LENGTH=113 /DNA_ID=CAMNT_0043881275 /DNA_START=391 /DNA_END=733 /DNA_ORIENTATION=-